MPTLTRWFLRAAMLNLVAALAVGLWLVAPWSHEASPGWRMVYVHLLVMGWATQMIFGVAYWMFPRKQPLDLAAFDGVGWTCFAAMNLGLALRAWAEPVQAVAPSRAAALGLLLAAGLQLLSILAFVVQGWPRVSAK